MMEAPQPKNVTDVFEYLFPWDSHYHNNRNYIRGCSCFHVWMEK